MASDQITVNQFIEQIATEFRVNPKIVEKIWWTCFRSYLDREVLRHEDDSNRGMRESNYLGKKGYPSVYIPADFWISIPE